ncbi:DNA mismatch repair protein Mlh1 [Eumeta japonica]|uniref:DNA mismatch repair protein Mlh1 n=1 Tax=Eumeta variegata TaxID=151549 RepID=A0A4C1VM52_EUMVA|nr:DNA mismatch repair protein Mlh1 [Eumeta japonica]
MRVGHTPCVRAHGLSIMDFGPSLPFPRAEIQKKSSRTNTSTHVSAHCTRLDHAIDCVTMQASAGCNIELWGGRHSITHVFSQGCRATYENGKIKGQIKSCAGNNGTQITVEDLFYNVVTRKRALRSQNEEYAHIIDVVGSYAIHNNEVGFTLKKFGENTDIKTPMNSSVVENVRAARLPGATIVEDILHKPVEGGRVYANNMVRVSSDTQKIDKFFKSLPKEKHLVMDVNKDVDESSDLQEESKSAVNDAVLRKDIGEAASSGTKINLDDTLFQESLEAEKSPPDKWKSCAVNQNNISFIDPKESFKTRCFNYERIETKLTSVKQLRMSVENKCNTALREIVANMIFIGCIDLHKSLIQYSTKLYLCDTTKLTEELFYEILLYDFQNFGFIKMSNPLPLDELFLLGLNSENEWDPELGDIKDMAKEMTDLLMTKRAMLHEYFSLEINQNRELVALPLLLDGHGPFMGALPIYLVKLVTEVNWESEKECFDTFSRQTAIFYSQPNPDPQIESNKSEQWKQEHIIFPTIRKNFLPPAHFITNGTILQIANLPDLYKVFERC